MSSPPAASSEPLPAARGAGSARLNGLDLARALALLAMIATHTLPLYTSAPGSYGPEIFSPTLTGWVYAGRSSVLFAVLAGGALVLMRHKSLTYLWTRSAFLVVVGTLLEFLGTPVLIILGPLATAMAVTALFRRRSPAVLIPLAFAWLLLSPWANQWLNIRLAEPNGPLWSAWAVLLDWLPIAWQAYPIPIWIGYSLLGAALVALFFPGQPGANEAVRQKSNVSSSLDQPRPSLLWLFVGVAMAVATTVWLIGAKTVAELSSAVEFTPRAASIVETGLWVGNFVPQPLQVEELWELSEFQWLPTPHSGAALAVWQHAACAVIVISLCLLLLRRWPTLANAVPVNILCGIGRWSLTNYVLHLVVLAGLGMVVEDPVAEAVIVFSVVLVSGVIATLSGERGPLESVLARVGTSVEAGTASVRRRLATLRREGR